MDRIETLETQVTERVKITVGPHSGYDSTRAEEDVRYHYETEVLDGEYDDLEVECIDMDYPFEDDTEVYILLVSFTAATTK